MILKKKIPNSGEIRCFAMIDNPLDKTKHGKICNHLLMKVNSYWEAAGEIKCTKRGCKALYEISEGQIILKENRADDQKKRKE